MPAFITTQMHDVIFPLLAHAQLSVREHAVKTFSSYLARSEFQVKAAHFRLQNSLPFFWSSGKELSARK